PAAPSAGLPTDVDAARPVLRDLVCHAPEQEPLRPGHALVADDDEVGARLLRHVEDRVGGIALSWIGLCVHATLLRLADRRIEDHVHVLARADGVGDVAWQLGPLLTHPGLRDRLERGHDPALSAGEPRQLT